MTRAEEGTDLQRESRTGDTWLRGSPAGIDRGRRKFFILSLGILTSLTGLALGIPFVSSLIAPKARRAKEAWVRVAALDSLPMSQPVRLNFTLQTEDAYQREEKLHSAWIIRRTLGEVVVFSPICTHLGCYFNWNPATGHFECPCHASAFSIEGKVLAGPAPRDLDPLPLKVEGGVLYVTWQRFKVGTPQRVPDQEG